MRKYMEKAEIDAKQNALVDLCELPWWFLAERPADNRTEMFQKIQKTRISTLIMQ